MIVLREIDQIAVQVANDDEKLSAFIKQHEFLILKTASKTAKHFISKNDDEWAIALVAFSDAIKKYDYERGSFISFAELIIHQNLVDYYRVQGRRSVEIRVERIEDEAIVEYNDNNLKLEIEAITQVLNSYDFRFMDLVDCSPKVSKTKTACAKAVSYILNNPILVKEMRASKQLPAKIIEKNAGVPRKILERHRKYLIAAAEILHGDYPYLSDYLSYIKEEDMR
ncbi:MAG: RNA polymerase subunit sigma [Sedimentibacter sp.]|uniref:RNA polymerase subunit sigma n=1 Tax=Sedimentibacter sp. TaxID=1960295 RepID=UPI0029826EA9|nr:RNA polymerase subunit sigma [Sedimentibacter sp.]MDW5298607.1 RNA polymerase subunit sigma [Sedimentibacter sp.]